jgi:hypothetical protein
VPDLMPYAQWSTGIMALSNAADQVLLLDAQDRIVDAVSWGTPALAGQAPFTGTVLSGQSLMRVPHDRDSDDAVVDFRLAPYDSPGRVP